MKPTKDKISHFKSQSDIEKCLITTLHKFKKLDVEIYSEEWKQGVRRFDLHQHKGKSEHCEYLDKNIENKIEDDALCANVPIRIL